MKSFVISASRRRTLRVLVPAALAGAALVSLAMLAGVGFAKSSVSAAQYKNGGCTNATLAGEYGIVSHGELNGAPRVSVSRLFFDGNGNASGVTYANPPGTTSADGNTLGIPVTATYQVRPDCTGYGRVTNGPALAFVLVDIEGGVAQGYKQIVNSPGATISAEGRLISAK